MNTTHPLRTDDVIQVEIGQLLVMLSATKCDNCKHKCTIAKITGSAALHIVLECKNCHKLFEWSSSAKITSGTNNGMKITCDCFSCCNFKFAEKRDELPSRAVVGAILAGATYRTFAESAELSGVHHLSESGFQDWEDKVGEAVLVLLQKSCKQACKQYADQDGGLDVTVDCQWSSCGYAAQEGTVVCCHKSSGKILYFTHCCKQQTKPNGISVT